MLELADAYGDALLSRRSRVAHLTSSALIFNPGRDRLLLVYHNLYRSWGWTGGHADGDGDLLRVALREAREETGIERVRPLGPQLLSLDILPVQGHRKHGAYVAPHLHLSVAYALEADEGQPVRIKADENAGVQWAPLERLGELVSEPHMMAVYQKIIEGANTL